MCVCRQRAGCLIAPHLTARRNTGPPPPPPPRVPQLTPSCYFHVQLSISLLPRSAVTSKLLFGYDRLSGNRPFPPLCLNRRSLCGEGGEGGLQGFESELKAGIITSAAERACPLWCGPRNTALCWTTVAFHSLLLTAHYFSERIPHVFTQQC